MIAEGPNFGKAEDDFFQSDRDIQVAQERKLKQTLYKSEGSPIQLKSKVLAFQISRDGKIYAGQSGHFATATDIEGKTIHTFKGHTGPVTCVAISGNFLFTGSWDKTICQWDITSGDLIHTYSGHVDFVKSIVVFGNVIYSASADKTIRKWNIGEKQSLLTMIGHKRSVEDLVIASDGNTLYSCSSDTTIRKWDSSNGTCLSVIEGHLTSVYGLFLDEESGALWSSSADKTVRRWDLESEKVELTLTHPDFVRTVSLLEGGQYVATGCRDEIIRIWDVASEKCLIEVKAHFGDISKLIYFQGDLFSASLDGTIRHWNLKDLLSRKPVENDPVEEEDDEQEDHDPLLTAEEERELAELMDE